MNNDSMRLVLAGGMIGLLVLSAAAWRAVRGPAAADPSRASDREAGIAASLAPDAEHAAAVATLPKGERRETAEETEAAFGAEAVPIFGEDVDAGLYLVALRVTEAVRGEKLFVCDGAGSPLEEIAPDRDGDQTLGPLAPGRYRVFRGEAEIGAFCLRSDAALEETEGRLWTDGELLCLERFVPGAARLDLTLPRPGYYSLRLCDRVGREWTRDLFIPDSARPDRNRAYGRTLEFRGLPEGLYTLVYAGSPLGQVEVRAGETAEFEGTIDN